MMQDNKALQAGHVAQPRPEFLQSVRAQVSDGAGGQEYAWNTSWGVSTRLIGGLVMTHGDDAGLRVPPLLAPIELVIVPIWRTRRGASAQVLEAAGQIATARRAGSAATTIKLRVHIDERDGMKPGAKYYEWELRGIPLRLELGPRDLDEGQCVLVRRDTKEKQAGDARYDRRGGGAICSMHIQSDMLVAARERREANSIRGEDHVRSVP